MAAATDDTNSFVSLEGWTAHGLRFRDVVNCTVCCKGVSKTGAGSPFETTMDHTAWTTVVAVVTTGMNPYQLTVGSLWAGLRPFQPFRPYPSTLNRLPHTPHDMSFLCPYVSRADWYSSIMMSQ